MILCVSHVVFLSLQRTYSTFKLGTEIGAPIKWPDAEVADLGSKNENVRLV